MQEAATNTLAPVSACTEMPDGLVTTCRGCAGNAIAYYVVRLPDIDRSKQFRDSVSNCLLLSNIELKF
jgi:hypothetical protein